MSSLCTTSTCWCDSIGGARESNAASDCVQHLSRFSKLGTVLLLGTQYSGLSVGVGVGSPLTPRHCAASAHCSGEGSMQRRHFTTFSGLWLWGRPALILDGVSAGVSSRGGWRWILSLEVSQHFQHGHNSTALKEIRRKDPQQQNKQGSQTVSP